MRPIAFVAAAFVAASLTGTVEAKGKGNSKHEDKGNSNHEDKGDSRREEAREDRHDAGIDVSIRFGVHDRDLVRSYFADTHGRGKCPPGLAKKNNGCLPPGQAKKRYVVGRALPSSVVVHEVPAEVSVRLGPAPRGYRYGIVDGDLVKLAVGTALVVDAIDGLVN
jgi:hypothetical protein